MLNTYLKKKKIFMYILIDILREREKHNYLEFYKKACISKQVFSSIYNYKLPAKDTVIKFAFALESTLQEAEELLKHAGYFLGDCIKRDLIFKFCFERKITDISEVNKLLEQEEERPLGSKKRN
jgi:hypothetical protein